MGITSQLQSSFEVIVNKLNIRRVIIAIKRMNIDWVGVAAYFAGGMFIGFLCRKYLKDVVMWLLIAAVIAIILDYVGLVDIRWDTIQGAVGTCPADTLNAAFKMAFLWIKGNVALVISFVIGFTIGIKAG